MPPNPPGTIRTRLTNAVNALMGRSFGPGMPIEPLQPMQSAQPRQFSYPPAVNINFSRPRTEYPGMLPFDQLRNLSNLDSIVRICIATRVEELQGLQWAVVAKNKKQQASLQDYCNEATLFWESPDKLNDWPAWIGMVLDDLFSIDAMTLYKHPDQGGRLCALELMDGATVKPLLDERGRTGAYQQILYGYPWSNYARPNYGDDQDEGTYHGFGLHELIYRPRWTRTYTPYGFPPTEWIILDINMSLRKKTRDLAHFTDGSVPAGFMFLPPDVFTPPQIAAYEEAFNAALAGEEHALNRIKFMPKGAEFQPTSPFSYDTAIDSWMLHIKCAALGVPPAEIGFLDDVNKATSEGQQKITYRRGLGSLTAWLKAMCDGITHRDLDPVSPTATVSYAWEPVKPRVSPFSQIEFQWQFGESEDNLKAAQATKIYYEAGALSSQEIRAMQYPDLDGPAPGPPPKPQGGTGEGDTTTPTPVLASATVSPGYVVGAVSGRQGQALAVGADTGRDDHNPIDVQGPLLKKADDPPDATQRAKAEQMAMDVFLAGYQQQLQAVTAALEAADGESIPEATWTAAEKTLTQHVLPFYDDTAATAAQAALDQLPIGVDWSLVNEAVLQLAQERAAAFSQQTTNTSKKQVANLIASWIETGGTLPDLLQRVERVYGNSRGESSSITEVTDLFARGNLAAWHASGVVKGQIFNTAADDTVCPVCSPLNGKEFDLGDESAMPPLHGRCRCWLSAIPLTAQEMSER